MHRGGQVRTATVCAARQAVRPADGAVPRLAGEPEPLARLRAGQVGPSPPPSPPSPTPPTRLRPPATMSLPNSSPPRRRSFIEPPPALARQDVRHLFSGGACAAQGGGGTTTMTAPRDTSVTRPRHVPLKAEGSPQPPAWISTQEALAAHLLLALWSTTARDKPHARCTFWLSGRKYLRAEADPAANYLFLRPHPRSPEITRDHPRSPEITRDPHTGHVQDISESCPRHVHKRAVCSSSLRTHPTRALSATAFPRRAPTESGARSRHLGLSRWRPTCWMRA